MRKKRRPNEQRVIDLLKENLTSRGKEVVEDESILDRPDALLIVDGKRIAVECTIFTPEKIMEYRSIKTEPGKMYQVFMPNEPHMWISKAINQKAMLAPQYKSRASANEVWLIVHKGWPDAGKLEMTPTWELVGYAYGVHISENCFDRICVVDEFQSKTIHIYSTEKGNCIKEISSIQFPDGEIPVEVSFFGRVTVQKLDNGHNGLRADLNNSERLCLQPMDKRYRVDYKELENRPNSKVEKDVYFPDIVAKRIM